MMIAMLAVAEGQHVQNKAYSSGAFDSYSSGSSSSSGVSKTEGPQALDSQAPPDVLHIELDILMKDPAFFNQLEVMADHMDTFAERLKAKPELLARAKAVAAEMFTLPAEESSFVDSMLPEKMEAMIADPEFQEQAQLIAEDMQKHVVVDPELEAHAAESAKNFQRISISYPEPEEVFEEEVRETMADPSFQAQQDKVAQVVHSLMSDPDLNSEAESIAFNVEQMKDSDAGHNAEEQISKQVNSLLSSPKLREKASDVVLEVLSPDLQGDISDLSKAVDDRTPFQLGDEWLDKQDMKELAQAVENPSPKLVKAVEKVRNAKVNSPYGLPAAASEEQQMSRWSQALSYFPLALRPRVTPSMMTGRKELAGPDTPRMSAMGAQPALGSRSASWSGGSVSRPQQAVGVRASARVPRAQPTAMSAAASGFSNSANGLPNSPLGGSSHTSAGALTSARGIRSMMPSLTRTLATRGGAVMAADGSAKKGGVDVALLLCFALWYLGNYYYNISNKIALTAAGGAAGFPMTIATLQLGVGVIYALFMWLAPDARKRPNISFKDYVKTLPVGAMTAGAHAASVFALSAGSVSFAQIVKASEPAFAAVIATYFYSAKISKAKWLSLIPVIGGVCLASLGELNFAMGALVTASIANIFAAIKGNENAKLMKTDGLSDRIGSVGNQFALTTINAFLFTLPVMLLMEGSKLGQFMTLLKTSPVLFNNLIGSGLWFYLYNELATLTIKKTNAVTQSVANTAKRVIVIIVVALVMKESLTPLKLIGSGIGVGGVFLYSIIDKLVAARKSKKAPAPAPPPVGDTPAAARRLLATTFV
jgi:solute carrier family 35 protein E1